MIPEKRIPTHPGEILLEEFLKPMDMPRASFAEHIGVPVQQVDEVIAGTRGVNAEMAWLFSDARSGLHRSSGSICSRLTTLPGIDLTKRSGVCRGNYIPCYPSGLATASRGTVRPWNLERVGTSFPRRTT